MGYSVGHFDPGTPPGGSLTATPVSGASPGGSAMGQWGVPGGARGNCMAAVFDEPRETKRWRPGDRGSNALCLLFAVAWLAWATGTAAAYVAADGDGLFPDFFGLWSYGRFTLTHPASDIYRAEEIMSFQRLLAPTLPEGFGYPFPYPPTFLLALAPLGALPYAAARAAFLAATFPLFLSAVGMRAPTRLLVAAAALAPVTAVTMAAGQSGFLAAALLVGGLTLAPTRPVAAGVLLGLLTYKPQLGILVPFALAGAGCWRAAAWACMTAATMAAAATAAFGPGIWQAWAGSLAGFVSSVDASGTGLGRIMPTVSGAMRLLGAGGLSTACVQAASTVSMAAIVWAAARREPGRVALTVLPAATFLATPYAFVSDMTFVVAAALAVVGDAMRERETFNLAEVAGLAAAMSAPLFMLSPLLAGFPCALLSACMLLAVSLNRIRRRGRSIPEDAGRGRAEGVDLPHGTPCDVPQ